MRRFFQSLFLCFRSCFYGFQRVRVCARVCVVCVCACACVLSVCVCAHSPERVTGISGQSEVVEVFSAASLMEGRRWDHLSGEAMCDVQVETTGNATTQLMAMAPEQRLRYFAEYLSQYYGPRALSPEALVGFDFGTEPTLGGGAQAHFPPGAWTALGPALRAPFGRVHFAGTEYAAVGFGYVEGAIQSGNATALELLRRLRP